MVLDTTASIVQVSKLTALDTRRAFAVRAGRLFTAAGSGDDLLDDQVVIVRSGRIDAIGSARDVAVADDVEIIDAGDATLLPGFVESHLHITGEWAHDPHGTHLEAIPETRILRGLADAWATMSAGFTTMFSMGHGHPNHVAAVRGSIREGTMPGPRIYHCGWAISQTAGHGHVREWNYDLVKRLTPRSAFVDGPRELRVVVRENIGCGADFIKIYSGEGGYSAPPHISARLDFTSEEIRAITDEAHRLGANVASHCMTLEHARHAVENGVDRVEHGPLTFEKDFLSLLEDHGAAWCPTLSQLHWGLMDREKRGFSPEMVKRIEHALDARCEMIVEALRRGITVGFGTDNRMRPKAGQNLIELRLMLERGIPAADAIRIATAHAAKLCGLGDQLGTIEVGKIADFVILDGDPTRDPSVLGDRDRVRSVLKSGVRDPRPQRIR